jgi:hypothetical protein
MATSRAIAERPRFAPLILTNVPLVEIIGHSTAKKHQETQSNGSFCHLPGPNDVTILLLESSTQN